MSSYAWVITRDHISEPPACDAGTQGPRDATATQLQAASKAGTPFKMYDDDGILYYEGRCWSEDGTDSEDGFGPLDDFGTPNAGCTEIRYRQPGGQYVTL
jgi:hypothetical protein